MVARFFMITKASNEQANYPLVINLFITYPDIEAKGLEFDLP
jgi:hypothetical protein